MKFLELPSLRSVLDTTIHPSFLPWLILKLTLYQNLPGCSQGGLRAGLTIGVSMRQSNLETEFLSDGENNS